MAGNGWNTMGLSPQEREQQRQQEMASQIQMLLASNPALAAQFGDKFASAGVSLPAPGKQQADARAKRDPVAAQPEPYTMRSSVTAQPEPSGMRPVPAQPVAPKLGYPVAASNVARPARPPTSTSSAAAAVAPAAASAAPTRLTWVVSSGNSSTGLVVSAGHAATSPKKNQRLAVGARVLQLEERGERMRYELLEGAGPKNGWVSTTLNGKALLQREEVKQPAASSKAVKSEEGASMPQAHSGGGSDNPAVPALSDLLADLDDQDGDEVIDIDAPSLDAVLGAIDQDEEEDKQWESSLASRERFFQMGQPEEEGKSSPLEAPMMEGPLSYGALQARGRQMVQALSSPETAAGQRARQSAAQSSGQQPPAASSLRERLQGTAPRSSAAARKQEDLRGHKRFWPRGLVTPGAGLQK